MAQTKMLKSAVALSVMGAFLMLVGACTCTTCKMNQTGPETRPAPAPAGPTPVSEETDAKVEKMFIPLQTDPKSEVIREVSQGLGEALMAKRPAQLLVVDSLQDATSVFKLSLKTVKFTESDWVEDQAAARPVVVGQDGGPYWKEYKRTALYQVEVEYAVEAQKPGAVKLNGFANGEASHELTFRQQTESRDAAVKPNFPAVPGQAEREKELAAKCGQELIKEITQKLTPFFNGRN